ncbi:MAG: tetratricopeptide repeat protein [Bacteroidota bacterium]
MRKLIWSALLGMAVLATVSWVASCSRPASQVGGEGHYLNLTADVQYTGRSSCRPCHQSIYDSYVETGMGKSFYIPERSKIIEQFGPESVVYDEHSGFFYRPLWEGEEMFIYEFRLNPVGDTTYRRKEKIDFIVGSGHQTRSYLMVRNDYYYEMPITWYVTRQRWDLSPGYADGNNTRFDREIGEECMACHTGYVDFVEGSVNRFREVSLGIDCEKCHGPGQIHIERMERDEIVDVGEEIDYSIVNPAKLTIKKQFDVCKQCHLTGVNVLKDKASVLDYRPGTDLTDSYDIYIERFADEREFGIASHAERLMQSRCFQASGDQLTCTTCHDPHKSISVTEENVYVNQCQSCHGNADIAMCGAPTEMRTANNDNCITCHMPNRGTSDIPHVRFHDHKIRVVRDTSEYEATRNFLRLICMTDSTPQGDLTGKAYLLYFERHDQQSAYLDTALQYLAEGSTYEKAQAAYYAGRFSQALTHIEAAITADPNDSWRQFRKGEILESLGRFPEAIAVYEQIYAQRPDLVQAGLKVGVLTLKTATEPGPALEKARRVFNECLNRKPFDHKIQANLAFVEMNSGKFRRAEALYKRALASHPDYLLALENMIILQAQMGNRRQGQQYLDELLAYHPGYQKRDMLAGMLN